MHYDKPKAQLEFERETIRLMRVLCVVGTIIFLALGYVMVESIARYDAYVASEARV